MRIIRLHQVVKMTGLKNDSIYRLSRQGIFPQKIKIGPRASGWVLAEVEEYIQRRIDARQ